MSAPGDINSRNSRILDPYSEGRSRPAPETTEVKDQRLMFSYLKSSKKEHQKIARQWNKKAYGKLHEIMLRNHRYVVFRHTKGISFRETISSNPFCPSFDEFTKKVDNPLVSNRAQIYSAPTYAEVANVLHAVGDPREGDTAEAGPSLVASDPAFTLQIFSAYRNAAPYRALSQSYQFVTARIDKG